MDECGAWRHLRSLGLPPRGHVALMAKNQAQWIMTDLAIGWRGTCRSRSIPNLTSDTVAQILDHSEAEVLIGKTRFVGHDEGRRAGRDAANRAADEPDLRRAHLGRDHPQHPAAARALRATPTISPRSSTSGSTGTPKGVMHSFRTMGLSGVGITRHHRHRTTTACSRTCRLPTPSSASWSRWARWRRVSIFFAQSLDTFVQDLQRAAHALHLGAAPVAQVPARRVREDAARKLVACSRSRWCAESSAEGPQGTRPRQRALRGQRLGADPRGRHRRWYRRLGLRAPRGLRDDRELLVLACLRSPARHGVGYVGTAYPDCECPHQSRRRDRGQEPRHDARLLQGPDLTGRDDDGRRNLKTGDRGEMDEKGRLRITGRVEGSSRPAKGSTWRPRPSRTNWTQQHPSRAGVRDRLRATAAARDHRARGAATRRSGQGQV